MSLLGTQVLLHGSNSSTGTYDKADAISTVSGLKETRAVHENIRASTTLREEQSLYELTTSPIGPDRRSFSSREAVITGIFILLLSQSIFSGPWQGSAQLTWLLDNPPGFWTIQLALSTAPEQNHLLFPIISYPIRCRSAPFINWALCTHFGKRAQNRQRMGPAYFTRLWTNAARSGKSATPTTSLEGEPSGTNSVRVPTMYGYLLFRSREGGGQNPLFTSYWRLFAKTDLELIVLNLVVFITNLMLGQTWYAPTGPERHASRYPDISDVSTSERLDIDDVPVSRCPDIDDVSTSRCPDIGYA
ncbi:hypothetical protein C8J55DRAFT_559550 [Lentinula edodes]|uniref:Uncharacterized protein n=1 Tax=Lentinula lateritia TaxID=40482 RepID=A0A9W9AM47_9AGAR|nr:hypothetical protein C8J55DRAFT_559550 [Lentinula edodes]